MIRHLVMTTTALVGLTLAAEPAAAQSIEGTDAAGAPMLTCTADATAAQIVDARDDLTVTIEAGAAVASAADRAMQLSGTDQTVLNFGLIESGDDNDAIRSTGGTGLLVDNSGVIRGTDRGIRLTEDGAGFTFINRESGELYARRQGIRPDNEAVIPDVTIENFGLISSSEGRAVQARGPNPRIVNHGTLIGNEEVVEAREGAFVENRGLIAIEGLSWDGDTRTWRDDGAVEDEDGIQFATGAVYNWGVILSTDDGVDLDSGLVRNYATGVIVSVGDDAVPDAAGIDVDEVQQFSDPSRPVVRPEALSIVNEGYIEGTRAINVDREADSPIAIDNSGTLVGRGVEADGRRVAIGLAPNQGDTTIALFGASEVVGDVLFGGAGRNTMILGSFSAGARFEGAVRAGDIDLDLAAARAALFGEIVGSLAYDPERPDGLTSTGYTVDLSAYALGDVIAWRRLDDRFRLDLPAGDATPISFRFEAPTGFLLDGRVLTPEAFGEALIDEGLAPIPLPAALPMLLAALGGLALRRRRLS